MQKKFHVMLLVSSICSLFVANLLFATTYGRYAVLIFGGEKSHTLEDGPEYPADSLFVEHEIAPMFDVLLNDYEFTNSNIYVHCLSGSKDSMEYDYFTEEVSNYLPATEDSLTESFHIVNYHHQRWWLE